MEVVGSHSPAMTDQLDPRVRRTRQMLVCALAELLDTTAFEKISVGDIADRATLNRATFYDHFADKYALLEAMVAQRFEELLNRRQVVFDGRCPTVLRNITLAMCDFLADMPGPGCPGHRQMEKHFEAALMAVVRGMLIDGLKRYPPASGMPAEMIAATISGAIYGGATEWLRTRDRGSAEAAAQAIFPLIVPILVGPGDRQMPERLSGSGIGDR
jgi:AcrR family transcriptional regulator